MEIEKEGKMVNLGLLYGSRSAHFWDKAVTPDGCPELSTPDEVDMKKSHARMQEIFEEDNTKK